MDKNRKRERQQIKEWSTDVVSTFTTSSTRSKRKSCQKLRTNKKPLVNWSEQQRKGQQATLLVALYKSGEIEILKCFVSKFCQNCSVAEHDNVNCEIYLLNGNQIFLWIYRSRSMIVDKIGCVIAARKDAGADQLTLVARQIFLLVYQNWRERKIIEFWLKYYLKVI